MSSPMTSGTISRTRILHVDDNPGERLLVAEAFSELKRDYAIAAAGDGYEAIKMLRVWSISQPPTVPNLILLDVSMPRMGGLDLLAFLKQHGEWRSIPVVILTNSQRPQERSTAAELGSQGFEIKPSSFEGYLELVHRLEANVPMTRSPPSDPG